jgi:DNA-binding SARP family transcriptional activator/Tfp pilus assembly protein PilF
MRFRVLGPLEVLSPNGWAAIGATKWRSLLASLLVRPGQLVPTETLIFEVWGDSPPSTANNLVSIYVHRLRKVIGDADGQLLVYRAPGYLLRVVRGDLDIHEFESLVAEGRNALAADPDRAVSLLAEALELWHGPLLADVPPFPVLTTHRERAAEQRLAASELRIEADIACGGAAAVVAELRGLVLEYPMREGLWALLIRALSEAGRHAEALEMYARARQVISDELGVDPGAELQRLYAALLAEDSPAGPRRRPPAVVAEPVRGEPAPPRPAGRPGQSGEKAAKAEEAGEAERAQTVRDNAGAGTVAEEPPGAIAIGAFAEPLAEPGKPPPAAPPAEAPAGPWVPPPTQLPADIGDFTGRETHVAQLCQLLVRRDAASSSGAVRIAVVNGAAGLGKTTLAVHAAHQVRAQFPDGQLYVDLLGASAQASAPGEILARFLRDLGVDGDKVPAGDEERAALYRTRLTGRRMLILLDNARDAAQVRPLLPGSSSCAVLVTTRNRAADLASMRFVDLNVLEDTEALALFSRIVGEERAAAEPDATAEVLVACAGLPLAIRICAARLSARRQWRIATMAGRLRDERRRLDEFKTGDLAVRASFQVSYDSLRMAAGRGGGPARAFRLLGLWQGQTISLPAAAALLNEPQDDIEPALEALVDANLIESPAPGWYRFHDLLRVYATERAELDESASGRAEAVARLLRWYVRTADGGAQVLSPNRYREELDADAEVTPLRLASGEDALRWYGDERSNVIAAIRQAASASSSAPPQHDAAWRLATALYPVFNRRDNWADCVIASRIGVASARSAGHRRGEAWALQNLGQALARVRDPEALAALEQALSIRRETGDRKGEAQTAISLADAYHKLQGPEIALVHSLRCLAVLREAGDASYLATGLNNHGEFCLEVGKLDEAAVVLTEALDITQKTGEYPRGHALNNLGRVSLESGLPEEAIARLTEADRIHAAAGDLKGQAVALNYLGQAYKASGDSARARQAWTAALALFTSLQADADAAGVSSALAALTA